jgi:putative Mg2+ transporter-C (MgtC) family protein
MIQDYIKLGLSLLLGLFIGYEREKADKPCGIRTITFIMLGATLIVLATLKWDIYALNNTFDAIRAIAYYLVAIGLMGGIIGRRNGKFEGTTTASVLLPLTIVGFLCGMGEFGLAVISTLIIYGVLKLKVMGDKIKPYEKREQNDI